MEDSKYDRKALEREKWSNYEYEEEDEKILIFEQFSASYRYDYKGVVYEKICSFIVSVIFCKCYFCS